MAKPLVHNPNSFAWKPLIDVAWPQFVKENPDLNFKETYWGAMNFLRLHRERLLDHKVIVMPESGTKQWFADTVHFSKTARACALGILQK